MSCAQLRSSVISSLSVIRNSRNSLNSCSAHFARSCDCVILPLTILSDSQVTTSCCSTDLTLARRVIISCMADAKLARKVSMSSQIDSIYSSGGGTAADGGDGSGDGNTDGSGDGEGDLDLLRDKDGKSDGGGEDDDGKSGGGDDNYGICDGSSG
ncbi:hypothetical protein Tco_1106597 [Tanacetum coccineum]